MASTEKYREVSQIKGTIDLVPTVIFVGVMILLSIMAGIFIAQSSIQGTLRAEVTGNERQFRAHMATTSLLNETVRNNISLYNLKSEGEQQEIRYMIGNRSSDIMGEQANSWRFEASNSEEVSMSRGFGPKSYSRIKLSSPSSNNLYITVGLGEQGETVENIAESAEGVIE